MAMKGHSASPRVLALLKPYRQIVWCHLQDSRKGSLTTLLRCSRCSLQPKPVGSQGICCGSLTPLIYCSRCFPLPKLTGPQGTCYGSLTPVQWPSWCILQPKPAGFQSTCCGSLTIWRVLASSDGISSWTPLKPCPNLFLQTCAHFLTSIHYSVVLPVVSQCLSFLCCHLCSCSQWRPWQVSGLPCWDE